MKKGDYGIYCEERDGQIEYRIKRGREPLLINFRELERPEQLRVLGMLAQGLQVFEPQLKGGKRLKLKNKLPPF